MKQKEFIQSLRIAIREEVSRAVKKELKFLRELFETKKASVFSKINADVKTNHDTDTLVQKKLSKITSMNHMQEKVYSTNSMLNNLLHETANQSPDVGEQPAEVMGNKVHSSNTVESMENKSSMHSNSGPMPDGVAKALTRDYSELMKKIAEKKGK